MFINNWKKYKYQCMSKSPKDPKYTPNTLNPSHMQS